MDCIKMISYVQPKQINFFNYKKQKMEQNEKPYQLLAWVATGILILAASLASFVPELEFHHWAFISANSIWILVGVLWREQSIVVLNSGLTLIYVLGLIL